MSQWLTPVTPHTFAVKNFMQYPQAGADETLTLPTYMNRGTQNDRVTFAAGGAVSSGSMIPFFWRSPDRPAPRTRSRPGAT